ncbi:MAG: WbqC family protein [Cytophagaceae bacterium]
MSETFKEKDSILLIELHYLPCLEYMKKIIQAEKIEFEVKELYKKQSYRNRCRILSSNKVEILSIPIVKERNKEFKDLRIDYNQKWLNVHWRSIQSSYGKSPYFEYFGDYFSKIYNKNYTFLLDLNIDFLTVCLKFLGKNPEWTFSDSYQKVAGPGYIDMRDEIHPKTAGISSEGANKAYHQVFGREFVNNLSIVDLLFNEGPDSVSFLT